MDARPFVIRNVEFVNADVKIVRCRVDNISVDVSMNRGSGVVVVAFLESVDRWIGNDHLFKRSVLLIKSWAQYESINLIQHKFPMLASSQGGLSSYALHVLTLALFNAHAREITHPFQALVMFFEEYADFQWGSHCVDINGPRHMFLATAPARPHAPRYVNEERLKPFRDHVAACSTTSHAAYPFDVRHVNIVDPMAPWNNLGKSVSRTVCLRAPSSLFCVHPCGLL